MPVSVNPENLFPPYPGEYIMNLSISRMSKALEDRFFFEQNKILSEQYTRLKQEKECVEALSKVSGITDQSVLKELVAHKIRPETLAALSLIPIIEVAWADGTIDPKEEKAILEGLSAHGLGDDSTLVQEWLHTKPDAKFTDAWKAYIRGLSKEISVATMLTLENDILQHANNVAEASGRFLGLFNPVSDAERAVLTNIETFFKELGTDSL
jgi:tellurite resistance protein